MSASPSRTPKYDDTPQFPEESDVCKTPIERQDIESSQSPGLAARSNKKPTSPD
eukprot:CAMPEP_0182433326 /NCGR_PEP_ID=MMETSP1167-20130531/62486_1 /TAXON_ID=2988 /ORGANISM="Mallomonas Sp, Strain CCMP3275" /LENGTH=53 /DNA_ID=CAMNT_0024621875 /DNA_START=51 /DNA_END=209 /DNA_ORIENTATION=-